MTSFIPSIPSKLPFIVAMQPEQDMLPTLKTTLAVASSTATVVSGAGGAAARLSIWLLFGLISFTLPVISLTVWDPAVDLVFLYANVTAAVIITKNNTKSRIIFPEK